MCEAGHHHRTGGNYFGSGAVNEVGSTNDLTKATHERFKEADSRYGLGAGEMTVCKVIGDEAGTDLRVEGFWVKPWEVKGWNWGVLKERRNAVPNRLPPAVGNMLLIAPT